MSDDLVKRIARAWAGIDGQTHAFEACAANASRDHREALFSKYMMQADELLRRSGLAREIQQLRCARADA